MKITNSEKQWGAVSQFFHWGMFIVMAGLFIVAEIMMDMPKTDPQKWELYGLHKSIGFIMGLLVIARLAWRAGNKNPKLPEMEWWKKSLAHLSHVLLYVAMIAMPASGYVMSQAGGHGFKLFDAWNVPNIFEGVNKSLAGMAHEVHEVTAGAIYILVAVHILAAVYHHFVEKDDILLRMSPRSLCSKK